jgi:NifU-like protein involved in Fe-S cluster formation
MKQLMFGCLVCVLCGCGAETATTAATAAAIKKQEIIEGQKMQDDMKARIERSTSQAQQRTEKDSER